MNRLVVDGGIGGAFEILVSDAAIVVQNLIVPFCTDRVQYTNAYIWNLERW